MNEGVYTDASVTALNSVLAIAEQVVNDESATQEEVNKQITAVKGCNNSFAAKRTKGRSQCYRSKNSRCASYHDRY